MMIVLSFINIKYWHAGSYLFYILILGLLVKNKSKIKIIGDKSLLLSEHLEVTRKFHNEKPISIELPKHIDCEIISTDAAIKGQTVSSSYKPAILNNNLKVQVPPFINSGDKITIDTRTLEYVKRVN